MKNSLLLVITCLMLLLGTSCSRKQYALFTAKGHPAVSAAGIKVDGQTDSLANCLTASMSTSPDLAIPKVWERTTSARLTASSKQKAKATQHSLLSKVRLARKLAKLAPQAPSQAPSQAPTDQDPSKPGIVNLLSMILGIASSFNLVGLLVMDYTGYYPALEIYFAMTFFPYLLASIVLGIIGQFGNRRRKWMGIVGISMGLLTILLLFAMIVLLL